MFNRSPLQVGIHATLLFLTWLTPYFAVVVILSFVGVSVVESAYTAFFTAAATEASPPDESAIV